MTTTDLLSQLNSRGIELAAAGDKLRFHPVDRLTPSDLQSLRQHKATILAMLRAECLTVRNPFSDPTPLSICDRCGCDQHVDIVIHRGTSTRRDCRKCNRFLGFVRWYGRPTP